ncbi:hypothetical protein [Armatimonas sp.]|uniref:hypothetical protein n=1 Tax=Armatimonas sp. TaxID=1872638 RepID=UPI00286A680F|nr:hypothetical protein [Armatimonas sp.]
MQDRQERWKLAESGIAWEIVGSAGLPHDDHVELSGRRVSAIIRYGVDDKRRLILSREVIWPTLRLKRDDVRGYLRRTWGNEIIPPIRIEGIPLVPGPVREVRLWEGRLTITHGPLDGIIVQRHLFPCEDESVLLERWSVINFSDAPVGLECVTEEDTETVACYDGDVVVSTKIIEGMSLLVRPGEFGNITLAFAAHKKNATSKAINVPDEAIFRARRWKALSEKLVLTTPDPVLNRAFEFAKWRAAESLFHTKMGLVHSPGGGRYYGGVWANDQAEYANPLFGYLGDALCHEASVSCYERFATEINSAFRALPSSFEVEGDVLWYGCGDRGDAAMIASGASRYALARGEKEVAEKLWPLIVWCLEFCRRKTDERGIVLSDTDELEGRFLTGEANLSTSCLAYDGYKRAADLAGELGHTELAEQYRAAAEVLELAIEKHFGAEVEGFTTYRYYEANTTLRAWICLPLALLPPAPSSQPWEEREREGELGEVFSPSANPASAGLGGGLGRRESPRRDGTIAALLSPQLWTADGLATESGDTVFWDRATLYGLRGLFAAGATEVALEKLTAYTHRRLLGEHVPYAVEAHPEGNQAHLSAESALYCRILTEGLFGIVPRGLEHFDVTPRLPDGWSEMSLTLEGFGGRWEIQVSRVAGEVKTDVRRV